MVNVMISWGQMERLVAIAAFFHSKNDDRSSFDSVSRHQEDSTSDAGTSERANPEKWKDKDLEWFPNPKGRIFWILQEYSAKILLVILDHLSLQGTLTQLFCDWKKAPVPEVCEALKAINHQLAFVSSDNPTKCKRALYGVTANVVSRAKWPTV